MYSTAEIIELITTVIGAWLTLQFVVCIVTFLLGNVMVDHVETGIFRNTKNPFLKFFTFIVLFLFGIGPLIYKKLDRFSWIVRRLFMLVITLVLGLLFMLIYYIIKTALHGVFL